MSTFFGHYFEILRSSPFWFAAVESVGREAVKGEQYDIRRGIAPPTLTLETPLLFLL